MVHRHTVIVNPRIKSLIDMVNLDAKDMKRMLTPVDTLFRQYERQLFASEGKVSGKPWPALSPEYAKRKRKKKPGRKTLSPEYAKRKRKKKPGGQGFDARKIMQYSGRLRKSLVTKGGGHVAKSTAKPTATLSMGTTNIVAAYHLEPKSGKVRDTISQSQQQELKYIEAIEDILVSKAKRVERVLRAGEVEMRRRAASGGI